MPAPPSCFAALPLVDVARLEALQADLPPPLRPIHPQDLHLTVAFFGRIDPGLQPTLQRAVAALDFEGADVALGAAVVLPDRQRATAFALGLVDGPGRGAVMSLMREHRDRLRALAGLPAQDREPLPHITFARPRGRRRTNEVRDRLLAWADALTLDGAPIRLLAPVLMRSRPPGGPGPHYEVVL